MKVFYFHDEMINEDVLSAGLTLAKEEAKNDGKHISIFVNVISGGQQINSHKKCFLKQMQTNYEAGKP